MQQSTKACLFGGALLSAGMAAQAQNLLYQDTSMDGAYPSFAYSQAYAYPTPAQDAAYAPDALDTYASAYDIYTGTTTVYTFQDPNTFGIVGQWDGTGILGYGYGGGLIQQYFEVDQNAALRITWDLAGTDGYEFQVVAEDGGAGTTLFFWDGLAGDPLTGSVDIPVSPGQSYVSQLAMVNGFFPFFFSTEQQFITAELIPAPGAAAVLALGGLTATRRRRR